MSQMRVDDGTARRAAGWCSMKGLALRRAYRAAKRARPAVATAGAGNGSLEEARSASRTAATALRDNARDGLK